MIPNGPWKTLATHGAEHVYPLKDHRGVSLTCTVPGYPGPGGFTG
jgi:hypothetical protein